MRLAKYIERVSQEDGTTTDVEIKDEQNTQAEPEEVVNVDELLDIEPAADNVTAELTEVEDIQESMEHFRMLMVDAQKRGGLRPEEGALVKVALEHFNKRLGVDASILSMEDYGGTMSRREATDVSLESLGGALKEAGKKAWDLIMELLKKLGEQITSIKNRVAKVMPVLSGAKARAQKAEKEATAAEFKVTVPTVIAAAPIDNNLVPDIIEAGNVFRKLVAKFSITTMTIEEDTDPMRHPFADIGDKDIAVKLGKFAILYRTSEDPLRAVIKVEALADSEAEVTISFATYLKFTGQLETIAKQQTGLYDNVDTLIEKCRKRIEQRKSDAAKYGEDTKVVKMLASQLSSLVDAAKKMSDIEAALAKVVLQVSSELERRASGKSNEAV